MTPPAVFDLAPHVVLPLERIERFRVRVLRGCVWITEEGHPRDIVIMAGEAHRITSRGLVLIEGMRTARVSIEADATQAAPARPRMDAMLLDRARLFTRPAPKLLARIARMVSRFGPAAGP